ncbi:MAG: FAD-binding protein [Phyllobacteriaceae bacterium]|nr:FAD-binding protein [Phyllobacteriaceae bacterium]
MIAALTAAERGARVVLDEAAPPVFRGGNTRHSRNLRLAHVAPTAFQPGAYPVDEFAADVARASDGAGDPALISVLAEGSVEIADLLARHGVVFQTREVPPSRKTAFFLGGGRSAINALWRAAERAGVILRTDRRVVSLSARGVKSAAVIAACGGAQSDLSHGFVDRGSPFVTGEILHDLLADGARSGGEAGAHHLVAVDARSPDHDGGIVTRVDRLDLGMVVDPHGRRFAEESAERGPTRYALWGRRIAALPGRFALLVLDAEGRAAMPPTVWPPLCFETLAELADAFSLDPAALAASAEACGRVRRPPFFVVPMRPGTAFGGLGVAVDARARVVNRDGTIRPGVFAAGMIMAAGVIGTGYVSGVALTIGAVFGRIAGEEAARHALGR